MPKHTPTREELKYIRNVFRHHVPFSDQGERYTGNRLACLALAEHIVGSCPPGADRDKALERLREVMFWANASIACNEDPHDGSTPPG